MNKTEIEKLKEAGEICRKVKDYAHGLVKKDMPLFEIAEKIERKIFELGGKPAFPINLSINEIAAHSTPSFNDETKAYGLLKVDVGVHIDGFVADSAFSVDLENNEENKKLIEAAEKGLSEGVKHFKKGSLFSVVGREIEKKVISSGFSVVHNLTGHSIEKYNVHAGISVPNFDNSSNLEIDEGVYAIEPFTTTGLGTVRDGKFSGIYSVEKDGSVRDNFARDVLSFILEEYQTLPFCSRWIHKKFGSRGLLALRQIEQAGVLHHYPQLVEKGGGKVAQAEHTVIVSGKEVIVIT
ncbi:MAG: type II methionyl aminopeptidase [Nanoarchaeota archaeon]